LATMRQHCENGEKCIEATCDIEKCIACISNDCCPPWGTDVQYLPMSVSLFLCCGHILKI